MKKFKIFFFIFFIFFFQKLFICRYTIFYLDFKYILNESDAGKKAQNFLKIN